MASRAFPAPPDISEILKFFALSPEMHTSRQKVSSSSRQPQQSRSGERKSARGDASRIGYHQLKQQQQERFRSKQQGQRQAQNDSKGTVDELSPPTAPEQRRRRPTSHPRRSSSSPPSSPPQTQREPTLQAWNGSTQLSANPTKPLKHQILDRTYQPPAPVVVDAADATHLIERLTTTTISSRLKRHQADQQASSVALTARATAKEQQQQQPLKSPPDTRARDGIQTLLMYRKEVEKRLSLDPTHYTKST